MEPTANNTVAFVVRSRSHTKALAVRVQVRYLGTLENEKKTIPKL